MTPAFLEERRAGMERFLNRQGGAVVPCVYHLQLSTQAHPPTRPTRKHRLTDRPACSPTAALRSGSCTSCRDRFATTLRASGALPSLQGGAAPSAGALGSHAGDADRLCCGQIESTRIGLKRKPPARLHAWSPGDALANAAAPQTARVRRCAARSWQASSPVNAPCTRGSQCVAHRPPVPAGVAALCSRGAPRLPRLAAPAAHGAAQPGAQHRPAAHAGP
jgi:hypothetical protein